MDDPIMWGFLPMRYNFGLANWNKRWGFGSHDICYQTRPLALFFTMGQVLPTHRSAHSQYGGLAQPVVTQAIRLLSKGPFPADPHLAVPERQSWSLQNVCVDPFSDLPTAYTTDGHDSHLSPSSYACNSYSWFHIFPEGKIHQAPNKTMRYFKWGVARLILEASECPDVVPIWLEGFDQVMHESREFPRFLPRVGKEVSITFGQKVDREAVFGEYRRRWQNIRAKAERVAPETRDLPFGVLNDQLLYDPEAVELRKEVTKKVRDLVLDVRRTRGLSDEDPKEGLVETWMQEGPKREGKMDDDSWHKKTAFAKPASTAHHTLASSGPRHDHHDRLRSSHASSSSAEQPSVNDLIHHLRRTQVSNGPESPFRFVAPRSVHPSLRNLLELPETPPPRPRPGAHRVGVVGSLRLRRTAGPPPPESWLLGSRDDAEEDDVDISAAEKERVIYRLERLPGTNFPLKGSLVETVLRSMATYWEWHIEYDGPFLGALPNHLKVRLLSYIAVYAKDRPLGGVMRGLRPLFEKSRATDDPDIHQESESEVTRLDLSSAIGRWLSLKQLSSELLITEKPNTVQRKPKEFVPSSWEEEYDEVEEEGNIITPTASNPTTIPHTPSPTLRFSNLRYLSLAHPKPGTVNWNSLISLLSRLSTITHLSLAHWPIPTVTPNAINARIRHPNHRSLTFSYGGTDTYSASENNWAEAAGLLRRLSRVTYCLKWLDLEGCGDWIPALKWQDGESSISSAYAISGPEWNTSWRDIEYIRLGPGWLPHIDDAELLPENSISLSGSSSSSLSSPTRSLAFSAHAPPPHPALASRVGGGGGGGDVEPASDLPWDVEVERIKYRRGKELERFRETVQAAKEVQQWVLRLRREGKGKWVQFSFGLEGIEEDGLKKLFGKEWVGVLP
ncbi:uncharacterized protein BO87DRAFT_395536 [Aspergillus neoniger CBS 115656]|uniref:Uncharacterized protein n=1 Tax=Aspergillus neoniger (strain CBS 115656) TaxID=1448310 RepID=A0A318YN21_ASPNB|nr:hypothetical protein BO87DRAFT_395536 [Aspergillus neoniger CBS 115656]PYH36065.1 hypothetical protein BO87DRAFT_395536 [Aspergillus neoniger CBS 115656]